jgi:hypothetical protein
MSARPVVSTALVAVAGAVFGLLIGIDLVIFGVLPLDSPLVTGLGLVGLVLGVIAAAIGSSSRRRRPRHRPDRTDPT